MIKLIADSTCDLSDEILGKYDIKIAPLSISFEGKTYKDRVDLFPDDFYSIIENIDGEIKTAMPSPDEFLKLYNTAVEEGAENILCICMSSGTSGSYQSAKIAESYFYEEHQKSDIKIHVVDSKSMSHGSGWLILKSAQLIEKNFSFEEIVAFNESYKKNVKHFLSVDDLDHLLKSGRLTNASAFIGKILRVKPIMSMKDGKGAIVAKVRGKKRVLNHYVEQLQERIDLDITNFLIIGYTSDIKIAENLKNKIENETDFGLEMYIMQMGVAVGTHVGLGGLSLFFVEKDRNHHDNLIKNQFSKVINKKDQLVNKLKNNH